MEMQQGFLYQRDHEIMKLLNLQYTHFLLTPPESQGKPIIHSLKIQNGVIELQEICTNDSYLSIKDFFVANTPLIYSIHNFFTENTSGI